MSKSVKEFFNISYTEGKYIYTCIGEIYAIAEVKKIPEGEEFMKLVEGLSAGIKILFTSGSFGDYQDYLQKILDDNINTSYMKEALTYIELCRKNFTAFREYHLYFLFVLRNKIELGDISELLNNLNIDVKFMDGCEITQLYSSLIGQYD